MGFGRGKGFTPQVLIKGRAIERQVQSELTQGDLQNFDATLEVELTAEVS